MTSVRCRVVDVEWWVVGGGGGGPLLGFRRLPNDLTDLLKLVESGGAREHGFPAKHFAKNAPERPAIVTYEVTTTPVTLAQQYCMASVHARQLMAGVDDGRARLHGGARTTCQRPCRTW